MNIQNSQNSQNIKNTYSPYVRGLISGAIAAGTVVAGAYAINRLVLSSTPSTPIPPNGWDIRFTIANGTKYGAIFGGSLGFLGGLVGRDGFNQNTPFSEKFEFVAGCTIRGVFLFAVIGATSNICLQGTYQISKETLGLLYSSCSQAISDGFWATGDALLQGAYHITSEALAYINPF